MKTTLTSATLRVATLSLTARAVAFNATALAVALAAAFPALAQTNTASQPTLAPVIVTANGIPTRDSDATYASEVHDRAAIEASGAASLYDYLAKNTSLNIQPYFGNRNQPALDMRGYGGETGFQNLVVVIDGYRLNNIDQAPAYLGGVPIDAIESIEISKGSGSVAFGDNAMAGVIQIHTRAHTGVSFSAMTGSRGAQDINLNAGVSRELFDLSFNANNSKQPSLSSPDPSGFRDGSDNRAERANLTLKPVTGLKLFLGGSNANVDTRYVNSLTPTQFSNDPGQSGGVDYTHQIYKSSQWRAGVEYALNSELTARYMHNAEDKSSYASFFGGAMSGYDSNYYSDDASLAYRSQNFDISGGVQRFKGERLNTSNLTTKDNTGVYLQGVYRIDALSLSAGARHEKVEYDYMPVGGTQLNGDHSLNAWDLGANYRFNEQWSVFGNLNQAFQAPDIDRFFTWMGTFNGLIEPAKSRNFTVGTNRDTSTNRLRVATFYGKLKNEIYYDPIIGENSNIDKSHKYGLEVSDRWQALASLNLYVSYTYTRAIIDSEGTGAGSFDGKDLPGVPRNGVNLGATWQPWTNGTLNVNHAWRDSAYAFSNFDNTAAGRQSIYSSTSLALRQRWKNIEGFIGVDNLFDQRNGMWTYYGSSAVYPSDFRRTGRIGFKVDLL